MGQNSSKIDQDTAKRVKRKILKNNSFLSYFCPFYHFGILKVCSFGICIGKSIILIFENATKQNASALFLLSVSKWLVKVLKLLSKLFSKCIINAQDSSNKCLCALFPQGPDLLFT